MKTEEKNLIVELLRCEVNDAKFAVEHCKNNGYGEIEGQVNRLALANSALRAISSDNNK